MKSEAKMAEAKRKRSSSQTGGGPEDIKPLSEFKARILGGFVSTVKVEGLDGGLDTEETQQETVGKQALFLIETRFGNKWTMIRTCFCKAMATLVSVALKDPLPEDVPGEMDSVEVGNRFKVEL